MDYTIYDEVKNICDNYAGGNVEITDGLQFSQFKTIKQITYYSHSRYLSGQEDSLGRQKPFYNTVNAAVNVAVRATDFDTKDVQVVAVEPQFFAQSFTARKELTNWMDEVRFDVCLNQMSETRARYGSVLVKRVIKDGQLHIEVVRWKNVKTDLVDIENNPIVETHFMSQLDLARMKGAWDGLSDNWDEIMAIFEEVANEADDDGETGDRIEVHEIQGELSAQYMEEPDENGNYESEAWEYSMQKHYVINYGDDKQFCLYSEELTDGPNYKILHWEEVDGRGLGKGIVEDGFESQTWTNDMVIKRQQLFDLASKIVFKHKDDMLYDNLLTDADTGDFIQGDFDQVDTTPRSFPMFDQVGDAWQTQYEKATSTFAAVTGETMPANTPLGSLQIQNQEARSIFDYRREQMGIFIEDMIDDWVMPHLMKKINKQHILEAQFDITELEMLDNSFTTFAANQKMIDAILDGQVVTKADYEAEKAFISDGLARGGDQRFIEVPKDFYKDMKTKVRVVTTNEKYNKQVVLQSLTQLLSMASQNPALLQDPTLVNIFARVVEMSGIGMSPSEIIRPVAANGAQPQQPGNTSADEAKKLGEALTADQPAPAAA